MAFHKDLNGNIHDDEGGAAAHMLPDGCIAISDEEATAILAASVQPPTLADQAQAKLDVVTGSRGTVVRCAAAGVALPAAWISYIAALRSIANSTDTPVALPAQPAYPEGT